MAKSHMKKKYVYINFEKNEFKFYHLDVLSVGFNEMQVISTYGTLGNKGRESIKRFSGEKAFKESMKFFYQKMYDKKGEGYINVDKIIGAIDFVVREDKKEKKRIKKRLYRCDECKKNIKPETYKKIDEWARGEGNWDYDPSFIGYKKILCIGCQFEYDIYRKKMNHEEPQQKGE